MIKFCVYENGVFLGDVYSKDFESERKQAKKEFKVKKFTLCNAKLSNKDHERAIDRSLRL